jgi:hypothetical protein
LGKLVRYSIWCSFATPLGSHRWKCRRASNIDPKKSSVTVSRFVEVTDFPQENRLGTRASLSRNWSRAVSGHPLRELTSAAGALGNRVSRER